MDKKLTMLMILDGFGINEKEEGNAIKLAKTPNLDKLMSEYPRTTIEASGMAVGLPEGQMGTSEVGHTNIGAGRIVYQKLAEINKSIIDGDFYNKKEFINAIENCRKNNTKLHLMGLLSDGGVHTHINHLYELLKFCKMKDFDKVYVHCFMDGRDTPPASGENYISELQNKINEIGVGKIATISGRYYAMDRDTNWDRIFLAYDALVNGKGLFSNSANDAIKESYQKEEYDEFIKPVVILENEKPVAKIEDNDSVIFYNFRKDRGRQLTRALTDKEFCEFEATKMNLNFVCFSRYDKSFENIEVAFEDEKLVNTFGEYISNLGLTQLRIAETEKYAHVTFYFNGGTETKYKGEDRILIPSPKVATYDLKPEMSAYEVTEKLIEAIRIKKYDNIIINYANPDMVGHTGILEAAIKAIETIDECVGKVVEEVKNVGGSVIITADHGNAEKMVDYETNEPCTSHTANIVPVVIVSENQELKLKPGNLADLAPTMLELMGIEKPLEMTGESLIIK